MTYDRFDVIKIFDFLIDNYINLTIADSDVPIKYDSLGTSNTKWDFIRIKLEFRRARKFLKTLPRKDSLRTDYDIKGITMNVYPTVIDAINAENAINAEELVPR